MENLTDINKALHGVEYNVYRPRGVTVMLSSTKSMVEGKCLITEITFSCNSERNEHRNRAKINRAIIAARGIKWI